jgi:hypothetical protein
MEIARRVFVLLFGGVEMIVMESPEESKGPRFGEWVEAMVRRGDYKLFWQPCSSR